jgi:hypothetical protein
MTCFRAWLLRSTLLLAVFACAGGCREKRQRLDQARSAERAASTRRAEVEAQQAAYRKERVEFGKQLAAADARLHATQRQLNRTRAAANAFVDARELPGIEPSALLAADPLFRLQAAVEQGDLAAVSKAASAVATVSAPCVAKQEASTESEEECDDSGYTDACDEVAKRDVHGPVWGCVKVDARGGAPALAFCTADVEYRGPMEPSKPWDTGGPELPTQHQIVRTAFVQGSEIHVADWPAPTLDGYFPPDVTVLEQCRAETERRACVHRCDVQYGRWTDPCSEADDDDPTDGCCTDGCCGGDGDGYEDCVRGCEGDDDDDDDSAAEEPQASKEPTAIERTIRLVESPAPGLFVVEEDFITKAGSRTHSVATQTHLLVNRAVVEVALRKKISKDSEGRGNFGQLETIATLSDTRAIALAKKLKALERPAAAPARFLGKLDGVRVLAGLTEDGIPHAYGLGAIRDAGNLGKLEVPDLCDKVRAHPQPLGAAGSDLLAGCDKLDKLAAKLAALKQSVESITSPADLIKFRKDLPDHQRTLLEKQRTELFKVYSEKQKGVAQATFDSFSERAQSTHDLSGIEGLHKELMDIVGVFELTGELRRKLEESIGAKRTALRKQALEAAKQRIAGARDSKELEGIAFDVQDLQLRTEFERARRTRLETLKRRPDAGRDLGGAR